VSTVRATEVTKPDGSRFISRDPDIETQARVYPADQGYSVRLVLGEDTAHGFRYAKEDHQPNERAGANRETDPEAGQ
jgi:hypothetical protein